jgi:hypothetical protein
MTTCPASVAHLAVVADMNAGHQQAIRSKACHASAARGAAADRDVFADRVAVAHLERRRLAVVLQILWRHADRTKRMKGVVCADAGVPVEHHMGDQRAALSQHNIGANRRIRPNGAGLRHDGTGSNDRAGMDAHSAVTVSATG